MSLAPRESGGELRTARAGIGRDRPALHGLFSSPRSSHAGIVPWTTLPSRVVAMSRGGTHGAKPGRISSRTPDAERGAAGRPIDTDSHRLPLTAERHSPHASTTEQAREHRGDGKPEAHFQNHRDERGVHP